MSENLRHKTIIPVAGGKGGVGKSLFTASLARALAASGKETIAVDLDLGGSNLYSYFGLENRHLGIGDYLITKGTRLDEITVKLELDRLGFIPGDGVTPFLANINYGQKQKLLRDLERLDADFLLLDLGSGTSFNILDFFRLSNRGVLVTTPDYPAIMNMMAFLKNMIFRVVAKGVGTNNFLRDVLVKACHRTGSDEMIPVKDIIYELSAVNPQKAVEIQKQIQAFDLNIVVNKTRASDDLGFVEKVVKSLQERLGIEVGFLASFPFSDAGCWRMASQQGLLPFLADVDGVIPALHNRAFGTAATFPQAAARTCQTWPDLS
ncbi:MAG: MinD/ParA family protein [Desulfuromonas sp.]|nr:MAG: MinD/ParA family protein [Desulfuromonas sp.]